VTDALKAKLADAKDLRVTLSEKLCKGTRIAFSTTTEFTKILADPTLRQHLCQQIKTVIIDEAGTAPEYDICPLAALPAVSRILGVGDIQQLPPFSNIKGRAPRGFMERTQKALSAYNPDAVRLLTRQFRMSPYICSLVSDVFYESRLVMDEMEGARRRPDFVPGQAFRLSGIYWLDYNAAEPTHCLQEVLRSDGTGSDTTIRKLRAKEGFAGKCEEEMFQSRANPTEVQHIIEGLELFCRQRLLVDDPGVASAKTVAVIAFYKQHIEVVEKCMETSTYNGQLAAAKKSGLLRFQTADSFQGSEADLVILSCVRSNTSGEIGFLGREAGTKRICVALSRAKESVIIIGDPTTMCRPNLAFSRLWDDDQPKKEYNVQRLKAFSDLARPVVAAQARHVDSDIINDLFS